MISVSGSRARSNPGRAARSYISAEVMEQPKTITGEPRRAGRAAPHRTGARVSPERMTALEDTQAAARSGSAGLHVHLDTPLPPEMAVGGGTALFVCGWCVSPRGRVAGLRLVVDGEEQAVMAEGAPRLDVFRALHPGLDPFATRDLAADPEAPDDPHLQGYRSGFWALARFAPRPGAGDRTVALRGDVAGGGTVEAELGRIAPAAPPRPVEAPAPAPPAGPLVAIAMATYEPPPELLRAQVESIRAQTHTDWICVISDDCSSPAS